MGRRAVAEPCLKGLGGISVYVLFIFTPVLTLILLPHPTSPQHLVNWVLRHVDPNLNELGSGFMYTKVTKMVI